MVFKGKKSSLVVGLLFILTAFVGVQIPAGAAVQPLVASAGGPYEGYECNPILFDASGSYNPERAALQYRWDFNGSWTDWSSSPYIEHIWRDDFQGVINLEMQVDNLSAFSTAEVLVLDTPPSIGFIDGPLNPVYVGENVLITVNFYDGNPQMDIKSLDTYIATYYWGDNTSTVYEAGVGEFIFIGSHTYAEPGDYEVFIALFDDDFGDASESFYITVVAPEIFTVDAGSDGLIDEGTVFTSAGSLVSSGGGLYTATVDYGDGSGPQPLDLSPDHMFDLCHQYVEDGAYTIVVSIFKDGVACGSDSVLVTVTEVPLTITSLSGPSADPIRLGNAINLVGVFNDPNVLDSHRALIQWGDTQTTSVDLPAGIYQVDESHTYTSAGLYTITLTVIDDDGAADSKMLEINVVDLNAGSDGFINEGDMFTSAGSFTCSTSGLYTATVDYGDGSGPQPLNLSPGYLFDLRHQYVENGLYTVVVTVFKDGVAFISDSVLVTVYNVAPTITSLSGPSTNPIRLGDTTNLVGVFTDPGVLDSHIALIEWGDGKTTTVNLPARSYQASGTHTYASAGSYTITLIVTDDDGGASQTSTRVVVNQPTVSSTVSIDTLIGTINGLKIPKGLKSNLLSALKNAQTLLNHHKIHSAINKLRAFINFVEAQRGKNLSKEQAHTLISTTRLLIDSLKKM
jgi:hypothetical protein